jgi:hypothetical protein
VIRDMPFLHHPLYLTQLPELIMLDVDVDDVRVYYGTASTNLYVHRTGEGRSTWHEPEDWIKPGTVIGPEHVMAAVRS